MPADPAQIIDGLYLASCLVAQDRQKLRDYGITHVLNTASEIPDYHKGSDLEYLHLSLEDDAEDDIGAEFARCTAWIGAARERGGVVLVHCQAGISRSATICMAYLMLEGRTLREAFMLVKARRGNIGPNMHYMKALQSYEDSLRPAEEQGGSPSFSLEQAYVQELLDMGFDLAKAETAVRRSEGRFDLAVEFCIADPSADVASCMSERTEKRWSSASTARPMKACRGTAAWGVGSRRGQVGPKDAKNIFFFLCGDRNLSLAWIPRTPATDAVAMAPRHRLGP